MASWDVALFPLADAILVNRLREAVFFRLLFSGISGADKCRHDAPRGCPGVPVKRRASPPCWNFPTVIFYFFPAVARFFRAAGAAPSFQPSPASTLYQFENDR